MAERRTIDLLPEIQEAEVKEIKKKGKLNLFGVFSVFLVGAATVVILVLALFSRMDYNAKNQRLSDSSNEIVALQYIEIKQKTLNTKIDTYTSVQKHDFSSDVILEYLLEVAGGLSDVKSMYLDDSMQFSISGSADSYINVARIWHDMAQQEDYFEYVNLENVGKGIREGDQVVVTYGFNGQMIRGNVGNL